MILFDYGQCRPQLTLSMRNWDGLMFRKPNKRIFKLALKKADLQPEDVWYIGDNYQCDVVGARSAGIFPVWYIGATSNPQGEDDVLTISHWDELIEQIGE